MTGRIVAASFSTGRALPNKPPIVAGTGYAALSTGGRRRQLGGAEAIEDVMPPNALARRKRALEAAEAAAAPAVAGHARRLGEAGSCASACEVWGDFDGDCEFNINDVTQLSLLQQQRSVYERAAQAGTADGVADPLEQLCPWQQRQANPNLDYLPNGAPNSDGNDAQWLLYAVFKYYRFLDFATTSCFMHEGGAEAAAQITVGIHGNADRTNGYRPQPSTPDNTDILFEMRGSQPGPYTWLAGAEVTDRGG